MRTDIQGCSTCSTGAEQWEEFKSSLFRNKVMVQYDYRHINGQLFSCVAANLEAARAKRDAWLQKQKGGAV